MAPNPVSDQYNILDWGGKAHWDAARGDWWFSGGPTGNQDPASPTIVRYRPSDDRFAHWQGRASMQGGIWPPHGHAHSFDAADLDESRRQIWRHLAHHNSDPDYNFALGWFNIDTNESGTVPGDRFARRRLAYHFLHAGQSRPARDPPAAGQQREHPSLRCRQEDLDRAIDRAGRRLRTFVLFPRQDLRHDIRTKQFYAILPNGSVEAKARTPITMDRSAAEVTRSCAHIGTCAFSRSAATATSGDTTRRPTAGEAARYHAIPWRWPYHKFDPVASSWNYMSATCVGAVPPHGVAMLCSPSVWALRGPCLRERSCGSPECTLNATGQE